MGLLKGDESIKQPKVIMPQLTTGLTISDGWNFGIGFGLALVIAIPVILFVLGLLALILFMVAGGLVGSLI
jgi:hypothetical protein